jgi:predicted secreted protein
MKGVAAAMLMLGSLAVPTDATGRRPGTIVLTEPTSAPLSAHVGQSVEIRLRSQPGTGFSWVPKTNSSRLTVLDPIAGPPMPGGWQTQRFLFKARRPGTYRLTFSYDRPWAGGTKGAKNATFTIRVR